MPDNYKEAAKLLSSAVNQMGNDGEKEFIRLITNEHRTIQQATAKLFLACFAEWAKCDASGYYDARNEGTIKASVKITEMSEQFNLPYI